MSLAWVLYRAAGPLLGAVAPAARIFLPRAERRLWPERLVAVRPQAADVWVHAASLGEAGGVRPLLETLGERAPGATYHLTATTRTGRERLADLGAPTSLAPLDTPQAARTFLERVAPRLVLIVETELWPQWLLAAARHGVPVVMVSARLSQRSLRGYARLGSRFRSLVGGLAGVLAQSDEDRARWVALGADPGRVAETGSIKFDGLPRPVPDRGVARQGLGLDAGRPLVTLGSLRPGEARLLAEAWRTLEPGVRAAWQVVAVPRHAHAAEVLQAEAGAAGSAWRWDATPGVLAGYYAAAEAAFVGGSLEPFGGHNPLEPAAAGCAVLMGPHHTSQNPAVERLSSRGAIEIVRGAGDLGAALARILGDSGVRAHMSRAALEAADAARGASARSVDWLERRGLWPIR